MSSSLIFSRRAVYFPLIDGLIKPGLKPAVSGRAVRGSRAVLATRRIQVANVDSRFGGIPNGGKGYLLGLRILCERRFAEGDLKSNARGRHNTTQ